MSLVTPQLPEAVAETICSDSLCPCFVNNICLLMAKSTGSAGLPALSNCPGKLLLGLHRPDSVGSSSVGVLLLSDVGCSSWKQPNTGDPSPKAMSVYAH